VDQSLGGVPDDPQSERLDGALLSRGQEHGGGRRGEGDVLGNVEHEDGAGVRPVRAPPLQLQRRRLAHQHRGTAPPRRAPRGDSASSLKEEGKTHRWSGLMGLSSAEDESMAAAAAVKATFQAMSSARTGRECAQSTRLRCSCSAAISCTSIEGPRRPAARPMSAARRLRLATEGGLEAWLPKLAASARRLGCGDGGHSSGSSGHGDVGRQVCCRGMAAGVRGGRVIRARRVSRRDS
jgi:hypothetical protein